MVRRSTVELLEQENDQTVDVEQLIKYSKFLEEHSYIETEELYQAQFKFVNLMATRFCRDTACRVSTNSQNPIALCISGLIAK